jgi:hypothetical protein
MRYLRQSTATVVIAGPFCGIADALPLTGLADQSAHARLVKGSTGGPFAASSWAHDDQGSYLIGLSAPDVDTRGRLRLEFSDTATYLPVWEDFSVLSATVYDNFFGAGSSGPPPPLPWASPRRRARMKPFSDLMFPDDVVYLKAVHVTGNQGASRRTFPTEGVPSMASVQTVDPSQSPLQGRVEQLDTHRVFTPTDMGAKADDKFLWSGRQLVVQAPSVPSGIGDVIWITRCQETR